MKHDRSWLSNYAHSASCTGVKQDHRWLSSFAHSASRTSEARSQMGETLSIVQAAPKLSQTTSGNEPKGPEPPQCMLPSKEKQDRRRWVRATAQCSPQWGQIAAAEARRAFWPKARSGRQGMVCLSPPDVLWCSWCRTTGGLGPDRALRHHDRGGSTNDEECHHWPPKWHLSIAWYLLNPQSPGREPDASGVPRPL